MTVTAVLGGTFDPVHNGHVKSALALADRLDATVAFVPCRIPAHRPQPAASAADRLAMLKLAAELDDRLRVDDCELNRTGVSYTIDTLRDYRARLGPSASLVFVMGVDAWLTLPTWEQWRSLTSVAHLLILGRPGFEPAPSKELADWAETCWVTGDDDLARMPSGRICYLVLDQVDVSATEIRDRLRRGEDITGLVPAAVHRYIARQQLYLLPATSCKNTN